VADGGQAPRRTRAAARATPSHRPRTRCTRSPVPNPD